MYILNKKHWIISVDSHNLLDFDGIYEIPAVGVMLRTITGGFYIIFYCWRKWYKFRIRYRSSKYLKSFEEMAERLHGTAISTVEIE